jgi:hypothetical protein
MSRTAKPFTGFSCARLLRPRAVMTTAQPEVARHCPNDTGMLFDRALNDPDVAREGFERTGHSYRRTRPIRSAGSAQQAAKRYCDPRQVIARRRLGTTSCAQHQVDSDGPLRGVVAPSGRVPQRGFHILVDPSLQDLPISDAVAAPAGSRGTRIRTSSRHVCCETPVTARRQPRYAAVVDVQPLNRL